MSTAVTRSPQSFQQIYESDFRRLCAEVERVDFSHKTLLISGATGFFGAWLLALCDWVSRHIEPVGFNVLALSRDPGNFLERHDWARNAPWLEWLNGDVRTFVYPERDIDWVIHAATDTSEAAGRNSELMLETAVGGTRRILDCARQRNASKILLVSSGAVYRRQLAGITHQDEDTLLECDHLVTSSAYGEGKRMMELLGANHADATGADVISARCFAFVGAGLPLDGHFAIGNFIRDALSRPRLMIGGDGSARRSYLYAADLAIWLPRLLSHGQTKRAYNVGSDQSLTMVELARTVAQVLAPEKPVMIENRLGPSPVGNSYVPSIARARAEIGLDVWTTLPVAIAATASWTPPFR